jgi:acetyl esterase/lipase
MMAAIISREHEKMSNSKSTAVRAHKGTFPAFLPAAVILVSAAWAMALSCNDKPGRYVNRNIFASVKQTSNIQFGSNKNPLHNNAVETLSTDIFQPNNDTCTKRPLVIMMWGAGFQGGSRQGENGDCQNFAKRGFVCATTDYRYGNPGAFTIPNFCGPTFMSTQDTRAAIRFYKKNGAQYGIDTSLIFVGGCSSGAYAAMHTAYLDETSEIPKYLTAAVTDGGIEGNSGNPGYSSRPAGVLALSGGLFDSSWITKGSIPGAMIGCAADPIESPDSLANNGAPPKFISNFDMTRLTPRFKHMEVPNAIKVVPGNCHCPHNTDNIVGDQSIDFLAKSAYTFMSLPPTTRISAIVGPQAVREDPDGAWFDLRGQRVETSKGTSKSLLRPGVYFRKPASALANRK